MVTSVCGSFVIFGYLWLSLVISEPFLSKLTLDHNAVSTYTKSYDGHPSANQPGHLSGSQPVPPTSLVIYVVCDGEGGGGAGKMESFQIFHVLSKLMSSEAIKQKTRDQALIQVCCVVCMCVVWCVVWWLTSIGQCANGS